LKNIIPLDQPQMMTIREIDQTSEHLATVKKLGAANAQTLGFFPEGAFDDYYAGALKGYGIFLRDTRTLPSPVGLSHLRKLWSDFHPPQCYRYLNSSEVEQVESFSQTISPNVGKGETEPIKSIGA
jgi:hypothetical protein